MTEGYWGSRGPGRACGVGRGAVIEGFLEERQWGISSPRAGCSPSGQGTWTDRSIRANGTHEGLAQSGTAEGHRSCFRQDGTGRQEWATPRHTDKIHPGQRKPVSPLPCPAAVPIPIQPRTPSDPHLQTKQVGGSPGPGRKQEALSRQAPSPQRSRVGQGRGRGGRWEEGQCSQTGERELSRSRTWGRERHRAGFSVYFCNIVHI